MNILPKKRWHVRTKENIARVRADEAKAAAEESEKERRKRLAESEARLDVLRAKRLRESGEPAAVEEAGSSSALVKSETSNAITGITDAKGHLNFFLDRETGDRDKEDNPEYIQEQKEEQEKYEKSVGYLTYLGQDTEEATGNRSWWQKIDRSGGGAQTAEDVAKLPELQAGMKARDDPLNVFKKYMNTSLAETKPKVAAIKREVFKAPSSLKVRVEKKKLEKGKRKREHSPRKSKAKKKKKSKSEKSHSKKHKKGRKEKRSRKKKRSSSSSSSSSLSDSSSSSSDESDERGSSWAEREGVDIDVLRAERLERERAERARIQALMKSKEQAPEEAEPLPVKKDDRNSKRKYHSQYNPLDTAKALESGRKYWLD